MTFCWSDTKAAVSALEREQRFTGLSGDSAYGQRTLSGLNVLDRGRKRRLVHLAGLQHSLQLNRGIITVGEQRSEFGQTLLNCRLPFVNLVVRPDTQFPILESKQ